MRRRRRKWPYYFAGVLCLCAASLAGTRLSFKKTEAKTLSEYRPRTWAQFSEYQRLEMLLQGFAIESLIDIPFVDHEIIKKPLLKEIRYIGITQSKDRARALQAQFGSKLRTFLDREITIDVLPKADLIVCWDKLCTMSPREVRASILQFKKSGAHFLLMRHYPEVQKNQKNKSGEFQPVNWTLPPYQFPEPIIHIMEQGEYGLESLALWNLENL